MRRPRRSLRLLLAGAVLIALGLGGCGIPDNSTVLPIGPGPTTGTSSGNDVPPTRNDREATLDKAQFVQYYLQAAAGVFDDAPNRVRKFLAPITAATFKPSPDIHVVRQIEKPLVNPGSDNVTVKVQQVGVLGRNGILEPTPNEPVVEHHLVVGTLTGQSGLFMQKAPPQLLLSDEAFTNFYVQRTIYFWNTERSGLVPDVRYMPLSVPSEQQPTEILRWLSAGPAPWLTDAVDPLPEGTAAIGNVPAVSNDKLQINLSDQALPQAEDTRALDRLRKQLMWSLRPNLPRVLELRIGHGDPIDYTDDLDYLASNFAYRLADRPERFVVFDGRIRRLSGSAAATEPVPLLTPADNRNVRAAAISTSVSDAYAAVVVGEAGGKQSLKVGVSRLDGQAPLRKVTLPGPLGHPSWAVTPDQRAASAFGLIPAGGALYAFTTAGGPARRIDVSVDAGPVTAVAIAPDAHRVAFVAGGRLYVSVLATSGDALQLSSPRQIRTPLREVTAVDWSGEGWLAVAGVRADTRRVAIMDVSIDGVLEYDRLQDLGTEEVSYLTAYPANPATGRVTSNSVNYVQGGVAYDALFEAVKITVANLAEPVQNPPAGVAPTAPFFLN
ncbi:LpqB family beta-propeller domain-containing protein [Krasilnikovia sp. MM14-A1004]|uniref:LpqB family beta-propeller domain-containing protein n=1 Tax=Krasilnikovia sp. MM14-A1004 TaxID=3373541 RepID=UPI00399CEF5F